MKIILKIATASIIILAFHLASAQFITGHQAHFQATITQPSAGNNCMDPVFKTHIKRITNASNSGMDGIFPDYSKREAWNADESLLMLRSGNGAVHIYNGSLYQFIKTVPDIDGVQDIYWHPKDPKTIYYILDNVFYSMNVETLATKALHTFSKYTYISTRAEGNMSNDGHYIALCGYDADFKPIDFFVYDIFSNSIHSSMSVSGKVSDFDWISVSPLGHYVLVDYATDINTPYNGIEVYDDQFKLVWRKPLGAGHSDCGLDEDSSEVLIMDVYDANDNITYINKYSLFNGTETRLLAVSPDFDLHESCRSMSRPGWVYVSTFDYVGRLKDDSTSWMPFEDEIFAVKMDGKGDVQRYAHHYSKRYSTSTPDSDNSIYFAEPHATVNKTGTRILFGSNWRKNISQNKSVDTYLIELDDLIKQ
jgi:hypothetical protein